MFLLEREYVVDLTPTYEKIEERLNAFIAVGTTAADAALQSVYKISDKEDAE